MAAHSNLGASSAHRWMVCPGSVRLNAALPPSPSSAHALEGTVAHALAEFCLLKFSEAKAPHKLHPLRVDRSVLLMFDGWFTVTHGKGIGALLAEKGSDMAEAVNVYLDWIDAEFGDAVRNGEAKIYLEQRVSLEALGPDAEGMFGTADLMVYHRAKRRLTVADYKHGAGVVVEVLNNVQIRYYALGAAIMLGAGSPFDTIDSVVVQPRAPHWEGPIRTASLEVLDLAEFSQELLAGARATRSPNAELVSGSHCRWCNAHPICPRVSEDSMREAKVEFFADGSPHVPASVEFLSPAEITRILKAAPLIEAWLNEVQKYAHTAEERGEGITQGEFKLVAKRAVRKWAQSDEKTADKLCEVLGLGDEDMFVKKLRTPADMEKLVPKDKRGLIKPLVVAESSGTTLVPASDKREAVMPSGNAAAEFGDIPD